MAKPKSNDAEPVSLFPFLSILACLIGVLTFIIAGISITQMDQSDEIEAAERTEQYEPIAQQLEQDREQLELLQAQHNASADLQQQTEQARADVQRLQSLQANVEQVAALTQRRAQANEQINRLNEQLAQLQAQVQRDQQVINERRADDGPVGTVVRATGTGVNLRAIFVECNSNNIVIHNPNGRHTTVPVQNIRQNEVFLNRCERVAGNEQLRLIFLVRPEAVGMYNRAAQIARERQVRYGKIPVPEEGPIDVSDFDHE